MIVGLGHQAQVGKDTAAGMLVARHGFRRLAFADILKEVLYDINPIVSSLDPAGVRVQDVVDEDGWEAAKSMVEIRRLLQDLGVAARWHLDENVWVTPILAEIATNPTGNFVVSDVRFLNEFKALGNSGALMVKMTRLGAGLGSTVGSHQSEIALATAKWDRTIDNNGSLLDLEESLLLALGL